MTRYSSRAAIRKFWQAAQSVQSGFSRQGLYWLIRSGLVTGRTETTRGFILPTVTLMLLMMSLVVGVLVFRSFNRTAQVIGQKQQRVLYNAATPAIERGKAKIEYVFSSAGLPALPSDEDIVTELANTTTYNLDDETRIDVNGDGVEDNAWIYAVDGDGDGTNDTTVAYSLLTYASRFFENDPATKTDDVTYDLDDPDPTKADNLVVRNGPINLSGGGTRTGCDNVSLSPLAGWQAVNASQYRKAVQVHAVVVNPDTGVAATLEMQQDKVGNLGNKWGAWFRYDLASNAPTLRWNGAMYTHGNFFLQPFDQNNALLHLYQISSTKSCVYDINASEITMKGTGDSDPSPDFQGQFVRGSLADDVTSSHRNFYIDPYVASGDPSDFKEEITASNDSVKSAVEPSDVALDPVLVLTEDRNQYMDLDNLEANDESVTSDLTFASGATDPRDSATWEQVGSDQSPRLLNASSDRPYVDDIYRADNRWGPSARYNSDYALGGANLAGGVISGVDALTSNGPASLVEAEGDFGLDGYWERRARRVGVRIVVGERLELGNPLEFQGDGKTARAASATTTDPQTEDDPLFPGDLGTTDGDPALNTGMDEDASTGANLQYNGGDSDKDDQRSHELRQWRSLRDNLAAVQAAAVYHYKADNGTDAQGQYPIACLAVTTHPGTKETDVRSRTFLYKKFDFNSDGDYVDNVGGRDETVAQISTDFFTGLGTNGLEFTVPFTGAGSGTPESNFQAQYDNNNSPLRIALTNLAYFAGDWKSPTDNGAYPPVQSTSSTDAADKRMRPDPTMTMWGNFSNLRRIIEEDANYADLSTADQTTLHTATCTLGILAHNLSVELYNLLVQTNALTSSTLSSKFQSLNTDMRKYIDGDGEGMKTNSGAKDDTLDGTCGVTTGPNKISGAVEVNNMVNASNPKCLSVKDWAVANGYETEYNNAATVDAFLAIYGGEFYGQYTIDDWRQVLTNDVSSKLPDFEDLIDAFEQASISNTKIASIFRDRMYGFRPGALDFLRFVNFASGSTWSSDWDPNTGTVTVPGLTAKVKTSCDPGFLGPYSPAVSTNSQVGDVAFALSLCTAFDNTQLTDIVRFPALYYLFPMASHYHTGALVNKAAAADAGVPEASQYYRSTTGDVLPFNTYVGIVSRDSDTADGTDLNFNNTSDIVYRPVEDGLASCAGAGCTLGTQNGAVEKGTNTNAHTDDEEIDDFARYLGVKPIEATTAAKLPVVTTATGRVNTIFFDTNKDGIAAETPWYPALLDTAFFDSRQQMLVRTLSIDLDLMRRTNTSNGNCTLTATLSSDTADNNGNCWLPLPTIGEPSGVATRTGAIIYAAREDAVREDAIARPASETWANCDTFAELTTDADCKTNLFAGSAYGQDPPLNTDTGLSPKAIDFVPDPDRRPHGFRLRNGSDLRRISGGNPFTADNSRGLSFITPNPLYIQGDFNLHTKTEFQQGPSNPSNLALDATWSNFYDRVTVNPDFATAANDQWRVAELASDGVTILSSAFCDGYIAQGIMGVQDCNGDGTADGTPADKHSFMALNGPNSTSSSNNNRSAKIYTDNRWWRENINGSATADFTTNGTAWPILISRNGFPVYSHSTDATPTANKQQYGVNSPSVQQFDPFRDADLSDGINNNANSADKTHETLNDATATTVNAIIIGGIHPARPLQPDGPLPAFLRLIEDWDGVTLSFSGSLMQLNFVAYSTGLQDQDAWEPGDAPESDEVNSFFKTATRQWGYDVALQYAPAGPVAQRFRTASNVRSEFYRELAIDDPYITNLRCATVPGATDDTNTTTLEDRVDPRVTATDCN